MCGRRIGKVSRKAINTVIIIRLPLTFCIGLPKTQWDSTLSYLINRGFSGENAQISHVFHIGSVSPGRPMDKINDRWGEFVITPVLMLGMEDIILDRIAFGGVKELEEIYAE